MIEEILKHCRKGTGGRRLLTAEQKRRIVEVWQHSELSGPEFCRRNDILLDMLYKWRKDPIRGDRLERVHKVYVGADGSSMAA